MRAECIRRWQEPIYWSGPWTSRGRRKRSPGGITNQPDKVPKVPRFQGSKVLLWAISATETAAASESIANFSFANATELRYRGPARVPSWPTDSDAAASAPRNIAEGSGRFKPKQFAQFVRIAKGSETEVLDILIEARRSGFLSNSDFSRDETSVRRAIGTAVGPIRYLERASEPGHREHDKRGTLTLGEP